MTLCSALRFRFGDRCRNGLQPERRLSGSSASAGGAITEPRRHLHAIRAQVQDAGQSTDGGIKWVRRQFPLSAFGKALLEQGLDVDQAFGVFADVCIDSVDAITVGFDKAAVDVNLGADLTDMTLDRTDADGEQTEPAEPVINRDRYSGRAAATLKPPRDF